MDDAWGSPWATADDSSGTRPESPPKNNDLSAPPPVFLSSVASAGANLSIPSLSHQSPWGDDDAFGDWAEAAEPASPAGWGVWASEASSTPKLETGRKDKEKEREGAVAWPRSTSPAHRGLTLPGSGSGPSTRQPSPDPWSSERYSSMKPISPLPSLGTIENPFNLGVTTELKAERTRRSDTLGREANNNEPARISPEGMQEGNRNDAAHWTEAVQGENRKADHVRWSEDGTTEDHKHDEVRSSEDEAGGNLWPSKATLDSAISTADNHMTDSQTESSSDSGFDEPEADSPVAPARFADRGELAVRPIGQRQPSKVRDLVDMYDGMSREKEQEPAAPRPATRNDATDEDVDDMVDGVVKSPAYADTTDSPKEVETTEEVTPETPRLEMGKSSPEPRLDPNSSIASESAADDTPADRPKDFPGMSFEVDLSLVDKLFPGVKLSAPPADDIPDQIIRDSFTNISERKLWYRIARYGSSRRHDSGLEDNYVRVAWGESTLRDDTIKIVRRWMEEDSFTGGRPTLGAGVHGRAGASHMFGWDSSGPAVDLSKVYNRRSLQGVPQAHTQQAPRSPTSPKVRSPSGSIPLRQFSGGSRSVASPTTPVATFGWSSSPVDSPVGGSRPVPVMRSPPVTAHRLVKAASPAIAKPIVTPLPLPTETSSEVVEEEDDEWGEMVSSPKKASSSDWGTAWEKTTKPHRGSLTAGERDGLSVWSSNAAMEPAEVTPGMKSPVSLPTTREVAPTVAQSTGVGAIELKSLSERVPAPTTEPETMRKRVAFIENMDSLESKPNSIAVEGLPKISNNQPRISDPADLAFVDSIVTNLPDLSYMFR